MKETAEELTTLVLATLPRLQEIPDWEATRKPNPEKWSKKEILGHLIDSAGNNQQKFVRTLLADGHLEFVGYEQDAWVNAQQYQQQAWSNIIALWASVNRHLAHVISSVDAAKLDNTISIGGAGPYTLRFIMSDYVEHLKHHLIQIIPDAGLKSAFSMSPYV